MSVFLKEFSFTVPMNSDREILYIMGILGTFSISDLFDDDQVTGLSSI